MSYDSLVSEMTALLGFDSQHGQQFFSSGVKELELEAEHTSLSRGEVKYL
jgi:hypothetical protein